MTLESEHPFRGLVGDKLKCDGGTNKATIALIGVVPDESVEISGDTITIVKPLPPRYYLVQCKIVVKRLTIKRSWPMLAQGLMNNFHIN